MAGALQSPASYGLLEFFSLAPSRPYHLGIFEAGANSNNVSPKPSIRTRHSDPTQYSGTPWTSRSGTQRGRLWLHRSDEFPYSDTAPGESGGYIHIKTGFFARHNRNHTSESAAERYANLYGWGECRAKELNGQIVMGNPCFVETARTGEFVVTGTTDADDCNVAELNDSMTYRACPFGLPPVPEYRIGQDGSGVVWKSYARLPIDIPYAATIVEATLTLYIGDVGTSFDCDISIMDVDDVDDFSATDANTNALWSTSVDSVTLAPTSGSGAAYILGESFAEQVQHVVNRTGWASGQFMGFAFEPVSGLSNGQVHSLAWAQANPSVSLTVRYRDNTFVEGSAPSLPPRLHGYQRLYTTRSIDTSDGDEMNEAPGGGVSSDEIYDHIPDYRAGSEYKWFVLAPVPPISSWHVQEDHGDPIYGENAHNEPYPFNEIGTYEIPCPDARQAPYRYRSLGDEAAFVYPGIRAAVSYAGKPPKPGIEPIYNELCDGSEASVFGLQESLIQTYEGQTATTRYTYPSGQWWVEYTGYIKAWLVYGDERDFLGMAYGNDPDDYGPFIHWNAWWEMEVVAKYEGPPQNHSTWSIFASWVNTHENRFGAVVQPKTQDQCNDILRKCAGVNCALGDIVRPSQSVQEDDCEGDATLEPGRLLPCVDAGNISYWYLPTLGSNHPTSPSGGPVVPRMPEYGLWHEFERVAYSQPGSQGPITDEGWVNAIWQTNHPVVRGVPSVGDVFTRNRIEQWIPFDPINEETIVSGSWQFEYVDTDGLIGAAGDTYNSGNIFNSLTESQLQTYLDNTIGSGNTTVTKTDETPETYTVEFTGVFAGMDNFYLTMSIENYSTDPTDEFEFNRTTVQTGKTGGLTE